MYTLCMLVMLFRQRNGYNSSRAMIVRGLVNGQCFGFNCNDGCDNSYGSYYGQDGTYTSGLHVYAVYNYAATVSHLWQLTLILKSTLQWPCLFAAVGHFFGP